MSPSTGYPLLTTLCPIPSAFSALVCPVPCSAPFKADPHGLNLWTPFSVASSWVSPLVTCPCGFKPKGGGNSHRVRHHPLLVYWTQTTPLQRAPLLHSLQLNPLKSSSVCRSTWCLWWALGISIFMNAFLHKKLLKIKFCDSTGKKMNISQVGWCLLFLFWF